MYNGLVEKDVELVLAFMQVKQSSKPMAKNSVLKGEVIFTEDGFSF